MSLSHLHAAFYRRSEVSKLLRRLFLALTAWLTQSRAQRAATQSPHKSNLVVSKSWNASPTKVGARVNLRHETENNMGFEKSVMAVLAHEGGYVNDPKDPGGETKYGISKRAYPDLDIAALTIEQAKHIYKIDYWHAAGCQLLADGPAYCLFDAAVNQGVRRAAKMMQKSVGVLVDGKIGTQSAAAVNADPARAVALFQFERAKHYTSLKTFGRFGRGWISNRVADVGIKALTE